MAEHEPEDSTALAGYIGARDLTNAAASWTVLWENLGAISEQQRQWWTEDQQHSLEQLSQSVPAPLVWLDFVSRRARHQAAGAAAVAECMQAEQARWASLHERLWRPLGRGAPTAPQEAPVLARLLRDHARFKRLLDSLSDWLTPGRVFDAQALLVMSSALDYFAAYPDAVHHPLEDRLFARIATKDLSVDEARAVSSNAEWHEEMAASTQSLAQRVEKLRPGKPLSQRLRVALEKFVTQQREHMKHEEERVFPVAERCLTPDDWTAVGMPDPATTNDPVFDQRLTQFDSLYQFATGRL